MNQSQLEKLQILVAQLVELDANSWRLVRRFEFNLIKKPQDLAYYVMEASKSFGEDKIIRNLAISLFDVSQKHFDVYANLIQLIANEREKRWPPKKRGVRNDTEAGRKARAEYAARQRILDRMDGKQSQIVAGKSRAEYMREYRAKHPHKYATKPSTPELREKRREYQAKYRAKQKVLAAHGDQLNKSAID